jgi:mannose-6-phosphate isomerase-like protein (cupin superfamily)
VVGEEGDEDDADAIRTAAIEQAMTTLDPVAHQCWAAAATDDYRLEGDISVLVTVDETGTGTVETHGDTAHDEVLTRCLLAVVGAYPWPPPMHGASTLLPFSFSAPHGQNVIDRALIPEVESGARVLLDAKNSGSGALSMFELTVPAGTKLAATSSSRMEIWMYLDEPGADSVPAAKPFDAIYLTKGAVRAPAAPKGAALHVLVIACPGGTEDATRKTGVLPAQPAKLNDKKAPAAIVAGLEGAYKAKLEGLGTVAILVDRARIKKAVMSTELLELDAGAAIPTHMHDDSDELLYLRAGSGTMVIDGVELAITGTSVVQIPRGVPHSFTAIEAVSAVQVYTPPGPEQRFKKK